MLQLVPTAVAMEWPRDPRRGSQPASGRPLRRLRSPRDHPTTQAQTQNAGARPLQLELETATDEYTYCVCYTLFAHCANRKLAPDAHTPVNVLHKMLRLVSCAGTPKPRKHAQAHAIMAIRIDFTVHSTNLTSTRASSHCAQTGMMQFRPSKPQAHQT